MVGTVSAADTYLVETFAEFQTPLLVYLDNLDLYAHFTKLLCKVVSHSSSAYQNCRFYTFFTVCGTDALEELDHSAV